MRMWNIDPRLMCRRHLLGEHVEMHMFASCIDMDKNLQGYMNNGLVDLEYIEQRHEDLAQEITTRGYNHYSPLLMSDIYRYAKNLGITFLGEIRVKDNMEILKGRCPECRRLINGK
jgi:hypothetical protein